MLCSDTRSIFSIEPYQSRRNQTIAMFERFTVEAIKIILLAQVEARRLGHNLVGTEQLLVALVEEDTGISARVLNSLGVNLQLVRIEVEKIIGRGRGTESIEIPFSPRAKQVLELSLAAARQFDSNDLSTEHILLGLIQIEESVAMSILHNLGVDSTVVRERIGATIAATAAVAASIPATSGLEEIWESEYHRRNPRSRSLPPLNRQVDPHQNRRETPDPLAASEMMTMLRSIDRSTTEINQSVNALRQAIVALNDRVKRIEDKLSEPIPLDRSGE